MSKIKEEADLHKDLPQNKLKRVIRQYKFLSIANTEIFNFVFYLITFGVPVLCMLGITPATLFVMLLIHFAFFWVFLFK